MTCRRLTAADTYVVCALASASFSKDDVYEVGVVKAHCTAGCGFIDTQHRGYALFKMHTYDLDAKTQVPTLVQLGVLPTARRQGVASALIQAVIACGRPVYLHVRSKNVIAQKLYAKHKFVMVGVLKGYYTAGSDDAYYLVHTPVRCLASGSTWRPLT